MVKRGPSSRRIARVQGDSAASAPAAGTLYVVATPIGNLQDLSERARRVLATAALVAAEDTRHSAQLLQAHGIKARLISVHEHNEMERVPQILESLRGGADIALVSDAGTPLVSDPGLRLVQAVIAAGFAVRAVPGPCAAIAALSVSGMATERFSFEGFLPSKARARKDHLAALAQDPRTLIFYEAPHRVRETLVDMCAALGPNRRAVVARELTKVFETAYRGTLRELAERAQRDAEMQRGELVIIVEGAPSPDARVDRGDLERILAVLLGELPVSQAAEVAAKLTGIRPNLAYRTALRMSRS